MAHQLAFIVEPIKDWKINVELNYRSNYNFNHTDYQTVYGYDVSKKSLHYCQSNFQRYRICL